MSQPEGCFSLLESNDIPGIIGQNRKSTIAIMLIIPRVPEITVSTVRNSRQKTLFVKKRCSFNPASSGFAEVFDFKYAN